MNTALYIYLLASAEWNISVLDHMSNLTSHGDKKQHQPVQQKDWPEDWNIKDTKQRHGCAYQNSLHAVVPAHEVNDYWLQQTACFQRYMLVMPHKLCDAAAHQNLNSGSLRTKGLNSSLPLLGNVGPSMSGSICGVRKPRRRLRLYIPMAYVMI